MVMFLLRMVTTVEMSTSAKKYVKNPNNKEKRISQKLSPPTIINNVMLFIPDT